jgi:hypothetical protein
MGLDLELVKWVGGVVGAIITVYIGLQLRGSKDTTRDHLKRTTSLEIAQVKHSSCVTAKLDALINSHHRTVDALSKLSSSVGKITASVARIEGVIEGTTMRPPE